MKVAVRLAILVATLLLVTNMAFAQCDQVICYDIVATFENGNTNTDDWEVCLNNSGTGTLLSDNTGDTYSLYLFGGGPGWFNTSGDPAIGGNPRYTTWVAWGANQAGFLQPIGDGVGFPGYLLTGEGESGGNRYTIAGKKVPCGATVCGNGIVEGGEDCDDGNTSSGDGCSLTCTIESGYFCSGSPSVCIID